MAAAILGALLLVAPLASAKSTGGTPVALVTAEQQNQLIAVELPSGRVLKRVPLPADPQNVIAGVGTTTVVVSPAAGSVTLLDWRSLQRIKVFRGFASPHLAAFHPSGEWAYVTDDAAGTLTTIELAGPNIVSRIFVGRGAHHMAVSPGGRRLWIALGEHATSIAVVDTSRAGRPRLMHVFHPRFVAHDLTFSPDGRNVWVTSGVGDVVYVLDARTAVQVHAIVVGAAPQHVVFSYPSAFAYATSGYGGRIVKIDPRSARILATARTPYGSFNVASIGSLVVTTSLLNGRLTEFDQNLHRLTSARPAGAARSIALTVWP